MYSYKGYCIPRDIGLLMGLFLLLSYYSIFINFLSIQNILNSLKKIKQKQGNDRGCGENYELILDKMRRGCNFFLLRIFRTDKPCLRRSLVLYRWCCCHGVESKIVIGVCKDGSRIKGHSWLIVNGEPYKEDINEIEKYTIILEG